MKTINQWFTYFKDNKKQLNKLKKLDKQGTNENFFKPIKTLRNSFIARNGLGFSSFNEATIKLLSQAYVNLLYQSTPDLQERFVLVATDRKNPDSIAFLNYITSVLHANQIKVIRYDNDIAIIKPFLLFSMQKIKTLTGAIFLSQYSHSRQLFALSFFNSEGNNLNAKQMLNIAKEYDTIDALNIEVFLDTSIKLDNEKLLNEYIDEIVKFNFNIEGNKLLKLGIITNINTNIFTKKILGRNDISYRLIKNKTKEEFPQKLTYFKKDLDFIVKFANDDKKVAFYQKDKKCLFGTYKLVDINLLIACYITFIKTNGPMNEDFRLPHALINSEATNTTLISEIAKKYEIANDVKTIYNLVEQKKLANALYFDENSQIYFSNYNILEYDPVLSLSIFSDMLNYFKTQNQSIEDIFSIATQGLSVINFNKFTYPCLIENLESFETKIFAQDNIINLPITNVEDLRNLENDKEKYLCKLVLGENEWLIIKFSKELARLVFFVHEIERTKNYLFKRLKRFFKLFCQGMAVKFNPELSTSSIILESGKEND
ncbi:Uncharacterised protein [Metamycoplasma arthritidis]|uniref:hypothetical protein n=1 Tax=Metamycoplasma arthritidis TaxID=2111 RepID=UPI00100519A5|nr:hypothetical protein [Metamycoplasma arthritidis]VEU78970.1 Uncharacterised protein [Metamycoplasma arthritidis]